MVFDKINNFEKYKTIIPHFESIKQILDNDLSLLSIGNYFVEDGLSYIVSRYKTESGKMFEAHHNEIDLQIIISGEEFMEIGDEIQEIKPYDKKLDFALYKATPTAKIKATINDFVIFYPFECHRPGICINVRSDIKKLIFKIKR